MRLLIRSGLLGCKGRAPHSMITPTRLCHTSPGRAPRPAEDRAASTSTPVPPPPPSDMDLRKTDWMRLHPVMKWTMLVDLGRRAPHLLDRPAPVEANASASARRWPRRRPRRTLANEDSDVPPGTPSAAARSRHVELCATLPYAARLHLALSLSLWIRALRDVQDTLARTRLPYAPTTRAGRALLAHVYPTRLQEHWVDALTTVTNLMDGTHNGSGQQVPAPHTWDPATSETLEDAATESTRVVGGHRARHGQRQLRRSTGETGQGLVRRVQGLSVRPSDDDARAARMLAGWSGTASGRSRRGRAAQLGTKGAHTTGVVERGAQGDGGSAGRGLAVLRDAQRGPPPVSLALADAHAEDARYHGNDGRGEGCPFTDDGRTSATPIYISTEGASRAGGVSRAETCLNACVALHAAVLSSLFIEGRTVRLSVDDAGVFAYAVWLLEELVADRYVSVELIDSGAAGTARAEHGARPASPPPLRPYLPAYAFPTVLVLMPPARPGSLSQTDVSFLADAIVQAAPCDVLVAPHTRGAGCATRDGGQDSSGYLDRLQAAVALRQRRLRAQLERGLPPGEVAEAWERQWRVSWVSVGGSPAAAAADDHPAGGDAPRPSPEFRPTVSPSASSPPMDAVWVALVKIVSQAVGVLRGRRGKVNAAADTTQDNDADIFLAHVSKALENNFYSAQLLLLPHNTLVTNRQMRHWLWQGLPDNVRLVGVNTSALNALHFYPHASFMPMKVGNLFRHRAVTRSVVARYDKSLTRDPVRYTLARLALSARAKAAGLGRSGGVPGLGVEPQLTPLDRIRIRARELPAVRGNGLDGATATPPTGDAVNDSDVASGALVLERTIDYLANPNTATLFALYMATLFRL